MIPRTDRRDLLHRLAARELTAAEALALLRIGEGVQPARADLPGGFQRVYRYTDPLLRDHTVYGSRVLIGVAHICLVLEAALAARPRSSSLVLRNLLLSSPLRLEPGQTAILQVRFEPKDDQLRFMTSYSLGSETESQETCTGRLSFETVDLPSRDLEALRGQAIAVLDGQEVYNKTAAGGVIVHGPSLRVCHELALWSDGALATLTLVGDPTSSALSPLAPQMLDGAILAAVGLLLQRGTDLGSAFVPLHVKTVEFQQPSRAGATLFAVIEAVHLGEELFQLDFTLHEATGRGVLRCKGLSLKRLSSPQAFGLDTVEALTPARVPETVPTPSASGSPDNAIERYLANLLAGLLARPAAQFPRQKNFLDLGVDSNALIQLATTLEQRLGVELYPTLFFEHKNLAELTRYFAAEHGERLAVLLAEAEPSSPVPAPLPARLNPQKVPVPMPATLPQQVALPRSPIVPTKLPEHDVAVIGLAGRFAGSPNVQTFWRHLVTGTNLITEVPLDHWDYRPWFSTEEGRPNAIYCKWGSFLSDVDRFDSLHFSISPREARSMDPQLRLLLEVLEETIEDAGYGQRMRGSDTGVYVGVCCYEYYTEMVRHHKVFGPYDGTGTSAAMLANRPSFYLDLRGPSFIVDTACSSSLIALHQACKALADGECSTAVVAGVNLSLSPLKYVHFSSMGALSRTGRCHSFDSRADGYVPGEAVAAMLLKPLAKALADGDHIHGVIKGTCINHGGYSNSVTAPNPTQEAEVIVGAWRRAGVDPQQLAFIEAHGTGTPLGDPVEVTGLNAALRKLDRRPQRCYLGSAKAHVGHTEGAAGVTGIVKALLTLQHRMVPAMPDFREPNPYLKLTGTPFVINSEKVMLESPAGQRLAAGVSSFGFGGAYAHVVLEEAPPEPPFLPAFSSLSPERCYLFSARTRPLLVQGVRRLTEHLRSLLAEGGPDLRDLAGSLMHGREARQHRLVLFATGTAELLHALDSWLGGSLPEGAFEGSVGDEANPPRFEATPEQPLSALAERWSKGAQVDWATTYRPYRTLPLPVLVFEDQRHWVYYDEGATRTSPPSTLLPVTLVPGEEQRRCTLRLSQKLPLVAQHLVHGRAILPGMAHLELVRRAFSAMTGQAPKALRALYWLRPLVVPAVGTTVQVELQPTAKGFRFRLSGQDDPEPCCLGELLTGLPENPAPTTRRLPEEIPQSVLGPEVYAREAERGLVLGTYYQTFLHAGGSPTRAIGSVQLGPQASAELADLAFHPALLDGALHCYYGLAPRAAALPAEVHVPYSLSELRVHRPLSANTKVLVETHPTGETGEQSPALDFTLFTAEGELALELRGFRTRPLVAAEPTDPESPGDQTRPTPQLTLLTEHWETQALSPRATSGKGLYVVFPPRPEELPRLREVLAGLPTLFVLPFPSRSSEGEDVVLLDLPDEASRLAAILSERPDHPISLIHMGHLAPNETSLTSPYRQLFELLRALLRSRAGKGLRLAHLYSGEATSSRPHLAMVAGLFRSAALEHPSLIVRSLRLEGAARSPETALLLALTELSDNTGEVEVRYLDRQRRVRRFSRLDRTGAEPGDASFRQGGVYLLSGGSGRIGRLLRAYLTVRCGATVLSLDRIHDDAPKDPRVHTREVDLCDREALALTLRTLRAEFGSFHGVLHAAGTLDDSLLLNKSWTSASKVLAPKVEGTLNLDALTAEDPLDCFLLFSSIASVLGNPGQCDYAGANAFLDDFAALRTSLQEQGRRSGATLCWNWPVWEEGGMHPSQAGLEAMAAYGLTLLPSSLALELVHRPPRYLARGGRVIVVCGSAQRLDELLHPAEPLATERPRPEPPRSASPIATVRPLLLEELRSRFSSILGLERSVLEEQAPISRYGMDSFAFTELAAALNTRFGLSLAPTILYEQNSLGELANYLLEEHTAALRTAFAPAMALPEPTAPFLPTSSTTAEDPRVPSTFRPAGEQPLIAIVGMSGVFPGSPNLTSFWQHLRAGHDLVGEVPPERWRWQDFHGDQVERPGTTTSRWGGFLEDVASFDAAWFNLSAKEAALMDPQHRIYLELVWQALAAAGHCPSSLAGSSTGVFVGITGNDYGELLFRTGKAPEPYDVTGNVHCVLPNRISYLLDLHGPSEAVDTACSSALYALHHAVRAIQRGDCDQALAGGINVILSPRTHVAFSLAGMLSPTGRCRTFDASADGYVRGEGGGVVFLRRLDQALVEGNQILAVIRGTALNHGGHVSSLTVPNPKAQAALITAALAESNVDPSTVTYLEAHGTGTALGDPIELNGLLKVFAGRTEGPCTIGSVKSNVGHLEAASGIAGLLKVLLALRHGEIPPTLHVERLNPYIDLRGSRLEIGTTLRPWIRLRDASGAELPRRAGISSFGFGGANAHLVVEEYLPAGNPAPGNPTGSLLFPLSARSEKALRTTLSQLHQALEPNGAGAVLPALDVARTLQMGREAFEVRVALVATELSEVRQQLAALLSNQEQLETALRRGRDRRVGTQLTELLGGTEALQRLLLEQLEKGRLDTVARWWEQGQELPWELLPSAQLPWKRVELPGPVFERQRHWVPGTINFSAPPLPGQSAGTAPLPSPASVPTSAETPTSLPLAPLPDPSKIESFLRQLFADTLATTPEALDLTAPLETLGIDSILVRELNATLERLLGELPQTLFFEYRTLEDLFSYLQTEHADALLRQLGPEPRAVPTSGSEPGTQIPVASGGTPSMRTPAALTGHDEGKIAIIGIAGRYPRSPELPTFWANLYQGVDCITEVPASRWPHEAIYSPDRDAPNKSYSRWGGFLDDVDAFDARLFQISPLEAELLDPQQRLLLECAWAVFEDAGYPPLNFREDPPGPALPENVGVFIGCMWNEYQSLGIEATTAEEIRYTTSSLWHLANRISYFYGLRGPSLTVDTACSSSLTALHLACTSLRTGECRLALAGGVNLSLHPSKYIGLSLGKFLSSDGRCRSFGAGGDGYVPGEGVGAVLLKPLAAALADGDAVYGVILGSSQNHGGKTNGFTVPDPNAQARVVEAALRRAGLDPSTLGYLEAHGTGTSLGDPVEIEGLCRAFRKLGRSPEACRLGSVKSNLGHLEAASGIAALTKVVLQLRHKTLVPSLHAETINPVIDFAATPFSLQRTLEPWPALVREGCHLPRRAAISSFGAGGANVHLVVEEFAPPPRTPSPRLPLLALPFSARTEGSLLAYLENFADFLKRRLTPPAWETNAPQTSLAEIASFLATRRQALEERLVLLGTDEQDLLSSLTTYLADRIPNERVLRGRAPRRRTFGQLPEPRSTELPSLARAWVCGDLAVWPGPKASSSGHPLGLPTYRFEKERYWVTVPGSTAKNRPTAPIALLEQRSSLSTEDPILADHRLGETCILPAAASLDYAFRAAEALPGAKVTGLRDVRWLAPLRLEKGSATLLTRLDASTPPIDFSLFRVDDRKELLLAKGCYVRDPAETPKGTRGNLPAPSAAHLFKDEVYDHFRAAGFSYGPSLRVVEEVAFEGPRSWARIALPQSLRAGLRTSPLHPSLIDGAFQTLLLRALLTTVPGQRTFYVPRQLERLRLYAPLEPDLEVIVEPYSDNDLDRYTLSLYSTNGGLIATLEGFSGAPLVSDSPPPPKSPAKTPLPSGAPPSSPPSGGVGQNHYYSLVWREHPVVPAKGREHNSQSQPPATLVFALEPQPREQVRQQLGSAPVVLVLPGPAFAALDRYTYQWRPGDEHDLGRLFDRLAFRGIPVGQVLDLLALPREGAPQAPLDPRTALRIDFLLLRALLHQKGTGRLTLVSCRSNTSEGGPCPWQAALGGLARVARQEQPRLHLAALHLDQDSLPAALDLALAEASATDPEVWYRSGRRFLRELDRFTPGLPRTESLPAGTYLLTGGGGKIGRILLHHLAATATDLDLVVLERKEPSADLLADFDTLRREDLRLHHRRTDLLDAGRLQKTLAELRKGLPPIRGVLHCAGVLEDAFLLHKDLASFDRVLAPKVEGTVLLDAALAADPLDFFVLFSSGSGVFGKAGQGDYAAANAFLDAFAGHRNHLVALGHRSGRTLAIDWPPWHEGGMALPESTREFVLEASGLVPLPTAAALEALERCLRSEADQVVVLHGDGARIDALLGLTPDLATVAEEPGTPAFVPSKALPTADLEALAEDYLAALLAERLKLVPTTIDPQAPFEDFGVDSVAIMAFNARLEKDFGALSKTLFYEHQNLRELARYLAAEHGESLSVLRSAQPVAALPLASTQSITAKTLPVRSSTMSAVPEADEGVAVIGYSGRFPQADDVEELWAVLCEGKDCVTEVPPERWPIDDYFSPRRGTVGKSYTRWGGFLRHIDQFDGQAFNLPPASLPYLDPRERLFLENVYTTLEAAGYTREGLLGGRDRKGSSPRRVGVFVGAMWGSYQLYAAEETALGRPTSATSPYWSIANRVSYHFDFRGPSMTVDTACSSSLVCLHLACEALRRGECEAAIAGGVNLLDHPSRLVDLSATRFASSDGKCRSFGAGGDGYVPGESVGSVLLKPLARALADGDRVHAILLGSAVNHGGKTNGYTVPNPRAQNEVMVEALRRAGVDPSTITVLEAHGTGTALGDPIELTALREVFGGSGPDRPPCSLGSIKSNLGHLESAAGIAALFKVLLQLRHRTLVPTLHSQELNPNLTLEGTPFVLQHRLEPWSVPDGGVRAEAPRFQRRAGLSSFGAGGTNAHLILEEYVEAPAEPDPPGDTLVLLSARTERQLRRQVERLAQTLRAASPPPRLLDVAFTLALGRPALTSRLAILAGSLSELGSVLETWLRNGSTSGRCHRGEVELLTPPSRNGQATREHFQSLVEKGASEELAAAWVNGAEPPLEPLYRGARRTPLPGYAFERKRYWIVEEAAAHRRPGREGDFLVPEPARRFSPTTTVRVELHASDPLIDDHRVGDDRRIAMALLLELLALPMAPAVARELHQFTLGAPLVCPEEGLALELTSTSDNGGTRVTLRKIGNPMIFASAFFPEGGITPLVATTEQPLPEADEHPSLPASEIYALFSAVGLLYGPAYRLLTSLRSLPDGALARLVPVPPSDQAGTRLAPTVLDAAFQTVLGVLITQREVPTEPLFPISLDRLRVRGELRRARLVRVRTINLEPGTLTGRFDLSLLTEEGTLVAELEGLVCKGREPRGERRAWTEVVRVTSEHAARPLPLPSGSDAAYQDSQHYLRTALLRTFQAEGLLLTPEAVLEPASLERDLGLGAAHRRLLPALLGILTRAGYLEPRQGAFFVTPSVLPRPEEKELLELRTDLLSAAPLVAGHLDLLDRCLAGLFAVLRGRRSPQEVIFPGGSVTAIAGVYRGDPVTDWYNELVATAIGAQLRHGNGRRKVLEAGAGTGGTTTVVLDRLSHLGVEITYTDISQAFLEHGRTLFAKAVPPLRFARLDLERDPGSQGFALASFEVVYATNVLHATRKVRAALANLASLLQPGGLLVLNETTAAEDLSTLTFGLLDGWWAFEDPELRLPDAPLLAVPTWRRVIEEAGGSAIETFGRPGLHPEQTVLLARWDHPTAPAKSRPVPLPTTVAPASPPALSKTTATPYDQQVLVRLTELVAEVLGMQPGELDPRISFADYGTDSVIGVSIVERLNKEFGTDLGATVLFEHGNLGALATHLCRDHAEPLARWSRPPIPRSAAEVPVRTDSPPREEPFSTEGLEERIVAILGRCLNRALPPEAVDTPFTTYGDEFVVDSPFVPELNKALGCDVRYPVLFVHSTPHRLAAHLGSREPALPPTSPSPAIAEPSPSASLDELLARVAAGTLSVDDAKELL